MVNWYSQILNTISWMEIVYKWFSMYNSWLIGLLLDVMNIPCLYKGLNLHLKNRHIDSI